MKPASAPTLLTPGRLLAAGTLLGWLAVMLWPQLLSFLGIAGFGYWFLDSYAILASLDAVRAGIPPDVPNPLDLLQRPHSYSDWWFVLGRLGLTREHNFFVGASWAALFLVTGLVLLRPRHLREALAGLVLMVCPVVLLAVNRANNDLIVFVLLAAGGAALGARRPWLAGAALCLAAGLKFYPAVAIFVFLLLRPRKSLLLACAVALAAMLLVMADVAPSLGRGMFRIPADIHKMGLTILLGDLGLEGAFFRATAAGLILVAGALLAARGLFAGEAAGGEGDLRERAWFTLGAVVLVACFFAGLSHDYRWIFVLLLAPWWWRAVPADAVARRRWRLLGLLGLLVPWLDGIFCLIFNLLLPPQPTETTARLLWSWRLLTQPWQWLFVVLLSAWLWRVLFDALATWRAPQGTLPAPSTARNQSP